jgi:hypothetical protein
VFRVYETEDLPIHHFVFIFADGGRMAYIDSELAKRRQQQEGRVHPSSSPAISTSPRSRAQADDASRGKLSDIHREPAALGKLMEIDLGDEARDRNVLRTEQARRRMGGEVIEDEEEEGGKGKAKGKVRLGRDGKPWRGRKRRGSEDIKRDKLVEEFLRENRCECFSFADCFSTPHRTDLFSFLFSFSFFLSNANVTHSSG